MNLIKYRALIKVTELGNITKAAAELGYSQPGISHMLDSLEKEAGFPLLSRKGSRITPTEDGKKILYYCYQIIKNEDYLNKTIDAINGLMTGTLHIGAYDSILRGFLPAVTARFSGIFPSIKLHLISKSVASAKEALQNGTIDCCFMMDPKLNGYEFIPLFTDPVCLIMPENHPLASFETITPQQLNGCSFIMPTEGWDDTANIIFEGNNITPNITHYVGSDIAGVSMVANNLGVHIMSKLQAGHLPDGVVIREFTGNYYRNMGISIKTLKHATPAVREFVKAARTMAEDFEL